MKKLKLFLITKFILLIFISTSGVSFGKCPIREYKIIGIVQDNKTNQPIADAKLIFFLDEAEWAQADTYGTKYPDYFFTNTQGSFTAISWFETYSGWFLHDRCNKKPKKLTVIIVAEDYFTKRFKYKLKKLIGSNGTINLPPIILHKMNLENPKQ